MKRRPRLTVEELEPRITQDATCWPTAVPLPAPMSRSALLIPGHLPTRGVFAPPAVGLVSPLTPEVGPANQPWLSARVAAVCQLLAAGWGAESQEHPSATRDKLVAHGVPANSAEVPVARAAADDRPLQPHQTRPRPGTLVHNDRPNDAPVLRVNRPAARSRGGTDAAATPPDTGESTGVATPATSPRVLRPVAGPVGAAAGELAVRPPDASVRFVGLPEADLVGGGTSYLLHYAHKSIRRDEERRGWRAPDRADLAQTICLDWLTMTQGRERSLANLMTGALPERWMLQRAVRRAIDRAHYEQTHKAARMTEATPALAAPAARDPRLDDLLNDVLRGGVGNLDATEKRVFTLLLEGTTLQEIGAELGMSRQRVHDVWKRTLARLRKLYRR